MKQYFIDRAEYRRRVINRYKKMKGCIDCGYKINPLALDFDHMDETNKYRAVGSMLLQSWKSIKKEISKCVVRCCNCHAIKTRTRNYRKKKELFSARLK